jgi:histidinol-phosphate aminotransferase
MSTSRFSRREFSAAFSKSLALLLAVPGFPRFLDAAKRKPIPDGAIRLNFNENPYGPSPQAAAALDSSAKITARYPDDAVLDVQDAIAKKNGVAPENIVLGCGSTEILRAVDVAYLPAGENVIAADPTFEAVLDYARVLHSNTIKVPLTADHRHDLPKMLAACTSKTGVVYICNPNNPTGTIVTREDMAAFVSAVPPTTLILVDEAYNDFTIDPRYASVVPLISQHPNVIVARTFSKIYGMAGMRLGYAVGAQEQISRIATQLLQDNVNAAVLSAALASLADQQNVIACRDRLIATRNWLCDALAHDGRSFIPSHANFVMIDMGSDVQPYIEEFKSRNVYVGRKFPSMPTFMRVTVGTQPEIEAFVAALRQIAPARAAKAA